MKICILLGITNRLSLLILLTGLSVALSVAPAMADPPTPVTCGSVITAPGEYVLAGDCSGAGITIASSDVHLKLNGHTMTGVFPFDGIGVFNVSHVYIEGPGTITSFVEGIRFHAVSDSHVEQLTCIRNQEDGLVLAEGTTDTHVNNNVLSMNRANGLEGTSQLTSDNHLDNNQASNNGGSGIILDNQATNYHVNGNTALGNGGFDLLDGNLNCDDNKWNGNTFVTADDSCIH